MLYSESYSFGSVVNSWIQHTHTHCKSTIMYCCGYLIVDDVTTIHIHLRLERYLFLS